MEQKIKIRLEEIDRFIAEKVYNVIIKQTALAEKQDFLGKIIKLVKEKEKQANFFYSDMEDLTNKKYERGQFDAYHHLLSELEELKKEIAELGGKG